MKIKKFLSIKNIGRLVNCSQKGPELNRSNLFFAENGRGKTTLCAVLRSLQTGKQEYIEERKTIGPVTGDPSASIRLDQINANYGKNGWDVTVPEITIFDATFVARNVHAGEYVGRDHRSNLLQVIIGEGGVVLADKVKQLDRDIRKKNTDINNVKRALCLNLPNNIQLDDFLALADDPEIEAKITEKSAELNAAKQAEKIKVKPLLSALKVPSLPAAFLPVLEKTLKEISVEAERHLANHIARHEMHEQGEQWISDGFSYLQKDSCPFCGQDTKGLQLIEAYKQHFSEAYRTLIAQISQLHSDIDTEFGDAALATLKSVVATNEASVQFWEPFTGVAVDKPDFDEVITSVATSLRAAAYSLISKKQASPLSVFTPDAEFQSALAKYENVISVLTDYNGAVTAANNTITAKKEKVKDKIVAAIEGELAGLMLVKLRSEPNIALLCTEYTKLTNDKIRLDRDKVAAKEALDENADKMIRDYETTINTFLEGFGAGFMITNSRKTYIGGKPNTAYQILINNQPVDLGDASTPLGKQCFRTTLSAGDKSTLALAFFLAQIEHDPKKPDRIVVFDDPFNSQDRSRRERTAELLKKYSNDCAQLFLFSHDPFFLSLVYSKLPRADRHTLQLSRAADNTATIEEWDVEKETQDGYFRDHAALSSYLLHGAKNLIDIVRKIRPVLEGYHRFRFPNQFPDNEWLGNMISRIRASADHPMYPALEELEGINDYSKKYHHDTNPGKADNEIINDGELQEYVKRTLAIVGGY